MEDNAIPESNTPLLQHSITPIPVTPLLQFPAPLPRQQQPLQKIE